MILYFVILSLVKNSEPWHLKDTGIFHFLSRRHAVIAETGDIFILNSRETRLLHFNPEGMRLKDAAVKGSAPGELNKVARIEYFDGVIYAYDRGKVHLFSPTGNYLDTLDRPRSLFRCKRVKGGWVGFHGLQYGQKDKPLQLMFYNEDFTESKILGSWASEEERRGKNMAPMFNPAEPVAYINPAEDNNWLVPSLDGLSVYLHPAYVSSIYKFDLESGKQIAEVKLKLDRIPFNEEWGMQVIKHLNSSTKRIKHKPWFPEFFPDMQFMTMSQDNHLVYRKWLPITYNPGEMDSLYTKGDWISIDENGNRTPSTLMDQYADRVVAVRGDTVWFLYTTEEGEHTVARCPKNKAADFLAVKMESND